MDVSPRMREQFINQKTTTFMKRFSIFCAALFAAVTSFAAVTYELNGGVTNDEGWLNKNDMFQACMADCGVTGLASLDELKATGNDAALTTICTKLTDVSGMMALEKWDWLEAYIMGVQNADAAATALVEGTTSAGWRYALAAFFIEGQRTSWPKSTSFAGAGQVEAFVPAWKHAFANPTEPTEEFVLNAPYKEGYTFAGWCDNVELTGAKVKTVNAETTGTLYAKWIDYVATVAEVKAMEDNTETQVSGVVTFINGKNVYVQDASGGMLLYMAADPTFAVGQKVIVKGTKVMYGGAPEVKGCVEVDVDAAEMPAPTAFEGLSELVNDSVFKYFATLVTVPGLTITEYDNYNNPTFSDGANAAKGYKMVLDPAAYPVGSKVTVTAIAAWYNGFQFVGDVAGIELAIAGKKENYTYPARQGMYSFKNNWVISSVEDNFAANAPGKTDHVRGMAVKDGIMYFINRDTKSLVRVNGATGDMLTPIAITGEHVFERQGDDGSWGAANTLAYNDIKFDQAGNCLIGACVSGGNTFQIYVVDLETGAATELISEKIYDNPDWTDNGYRFDAFGVAGDVTSNGVVMAADANSWTVYRWLITDGVAAKAEQIAMSLDPEVDNYLANTSSSFGTAPQIFPQDEAGSLFYVDGFATLPMLFDETGALIDDFANLAAEKREITNNEGESSLSLATGLNGLCEFQVGEEYFLVMVAGHTTSSAPSSFALYKFADDYRMFEEMEPLWYFPHNGLGSLTNGCRTAVPSVEVSGNKATIYIYGNNNGYASYTLTIGEAETDVENVEATEIGARKVVENGQVYVIKNGVKYNLLGAEVK